MSFISSLIIPLMVLFIIIYGILKKIDVYDTFLSGCKESFEMIFTIFPNLVAMILGINLLINSDSLNILNFIFKPICDIIEIPIEIVPMALMRPISGSSTLAILNNLISKFGVDSYISTLASVIQGATDTTFYVITLYFASIGIKKIRYSLVAGLFADLMGIVGAIIVVKLMF